MTLSDPKVKQIIRNAIQKCFLQDFRTLFILLMLVLVSAVSLLFACLARVADYACSFVKCHFPQQQIQQGETDYD
jgi:hypothetical protein